MASRLTGRTRLAVLAVDLAVLVGGVVGLSTIGPSSRDVVAAGGRTNVLSQGSTSTTTVRSTTASSNSFTVQRGSTSTTRVRSRTGETTAPAKSTDTSAGGLPATREGVYETRVTEEYTGEAEEGEEPEEPTTDTEIVTVRTSQRTATEVRQVQTSRDPEDEGDEGDEQEFRWTEDALFLVAPIDDPSDCSSEELRWLKLPLATGSSWSDRMECSYDADPDDSREPNRIEVEITSKVTGSRQVQAAGRSLFVWEIESEMRSRMSGASAGFDSVLVRHTQFSPELGFEVRAVEEHRAEGGSSSEFSYRSTTELVKAP